MRMRARTALGPTLFHGRAQFGYNNVSFSGAGGPGEQLAAILPPPHEAIPVRRPSSKPARPHAFRYASFAPSASIRSSPALLLLIPMYVKCNLNRTPAVIPMASPAPTNRSQVRLQLLLRPRHSIISPPASGQPARHLRRLSIEQLRHRSLLADTSIYTPPRDIPVRLDT